MFFPLTLTLLITALAAIVLISGKVRPDLVGLMVALSLALTGVLPLKSALGGFSSDVVFVLLSIFILTKGLENTGVTAWLGERLARLGSGSEGRLVGVTMVASAVLSLFMNTVAAAAVLLPPVLAITRRRRDVAPSRVLIPLAYATLLGGTATLLTTANLVTSASLAAHGLKPYGLLDFLPVGLPVTAAGLLFMLLVGRRLLPRYPAEPGGEALADLVEAYRLREGLHAFRVAPDSPLVGRPARKPRTATDAGLTPVGLLVGGRIAFADRLPPERRLRPGDILVVVGTSPPDVLAHLGLEPWDAPDLYDIFRTQAVLVELALNPRGNAAGKTPQSLQLYARYGLRILAVRRGSEVLEHNLYTLPLRQGDALLALIPAENEPHLRDDADFVVLSVHRGEGGSVGWRGFLAIALLVAALVPAALGWAPLALTTLSAATLMMLVGIVPPPQAYRVIPWQVLFLIGGMIPLGVAMRQTGAATFLSRQMLLPLEHAPGWAIAAAFLLLTALLAQVTSGQVAALLLAPLAIAAAESYGLPPRGLGMAVAVGASFAFLLPTGHPVNLLVMQPGRYKPADYLKVGLPLLLVVTPVAVVALQWFWLR